jgi:hypothetical protein
MQRCCCCCCCWCWWCCGCLCKGSGCLSSNPATASKPRGCSLRGVHVCGGRPGGGAGRTRRPTCAEVMADAAGAPVRSCAKLSRCARSNRPARSEASEARPGASPANRTRASCKAGSVATCARRSASVGVESRTASQRRGCAGRRFCALLPRHEDKCPPTYPSALRRFPQQPRGRQCTQCRGRAGELRGGYGLCSIAAWLRAVAARHAGTVQAVSLLLEGRGGAASGLCTQEVRAQATAPLPLGQWAGPVAHAAA